MKFPVQTRLAVLFISTVLVGACTADTSLRSRVESYLADNITDLSPRAATQGRFTVDDVEWVDDDTVRVTYTDEAGVKFHGIGDVVSNAARMIKNFRIDTSFNSSSSSSSSTSSTSSSSSSSNSTSNASATSSMSKTSSSSRISDDDDDDDSSSSVSVSSSSVTSAMSTSSL